MPENHPAREIAGAATIFECPANGLERAARAIVRPADGFVWAADDFAPVTMTVELTTIKFVPPADSSVTLAETFARAAKGKEGAANGFVLAANGFVLSANALKSPANGIKILTIDGELLTARPANIRYTSLHHS